MGYSWTTKVANVTPIAASHINLLQTEKLDCLDPVLDGYDRPSAGPTVAVGVAGALTGTYYYRYSYVTADGETEVGPVSSSVAP